MYPGEGKHSLLTRGKAAQKNNPKRHLKKKKPKTEGGKPTKRGGEDTFTRGALGRREKRNNA